MHFQYTLQYRSYHYGSLFYGSVIQTFRLCVWQPLNSRQQLWQIRSTSLKILSIIHSYVFWIIIPAITQSCSVGNCINRNTRKNVWIYRNGVLYKYVKECINLLMIFHAITSLHGEMFKIVTHQFSYFVYSKTITYKQIKHINWFQSFQNVKR